LYVKHYQTIACGPTDPSPSGAFERQPFAACTFVLAKTAELARGDAGQNTVAQSTNE
jgi:hypothetical protein